MRKVWSFLCAGVLLAAASCGDRNVVKLDAAVVVDHQIDDSGQIIDHAIQPDGYQFNDGYNPDGPVIWDGPYKDKIFFDQSVKPDKAVVDQAIPPDTAPPPPNDKCANAKTLTLSGGKASVSDTTAPYANEYGTAINCSISYYTMQGPQLYYKVALKANQGYKITLSPKYNTARFYIFTACGATKINQDCSSKGKTGDVSGYIYTNQSGTVIFKPTTAGTYYIAVDSTYASYGGSFTLSVEEYTTPTNGKCASAKTLTVPVGGSVTELGSTVGAPNEFGTGINCGLSSPFAGNMVYYKATLTAGKTYNITLKANWYYASLIVFGNTCTMSAINADCSSGGTKGAYDYTPTNGDKLIQFKPSTSGTYHIAVTAYYYTTYFGSFELTIEDYTPPTNTKCSNPKQLTLTGGKVTVKGTTAGVANEFGNQITCGYSSSYALQGPQVYYSVALTAGKSYKISLTPSYYGAVYLFNSLCTAAAINGSCGSGGGTGAVDNYIYPNNTESITFTPKTSGTWKIAVDSRITSSGYNSGSFTLTVEEYTPPTNGECLLSKGITLTGGKATVTSDTTGMSNQFGTQITCNYYSGQFDGPQLYYHISLTAGKSYRVRLTPSFYYSRFYIFGNTCIVNTINSQCGSGGTNGLYALGSSTTAYQAIFTPSTSGVYKIAVDSGSPTYFGAFTLEVEEYAQPKNTTCANAQSVTLSSSGTATVSGDTTGVANEFGTSINCGGGTSSIMRGPQLYYKVALTAGKTYTFTLTGNWSYKRLYIFRTPATCTYTLPTISAINTDCGSGGTWGAVSGNVSASQPAVISFKPTTSGTFTFAVDSTYFSTTYGFGPFTVTIK
jgi:hypothetical protein